MRMRLLAVAGLLALVGAGPARAADVSPSPVAKAPDEPTWTGLYVGAELGFKRGGFDWSTTCFGPTGGSCPTPLPGVFNPFSPAASSPRPSAPAGRTAGRP